jgi:hypothetical protein
VSLDKPFDLIEGHPPLILRFEQQMTHLRENLKGPELRKLLESANQFGKNRG